jgi:metal-responsive CopG/Arc/MetJ family transcriptional regulator
MSQNEDSIVISSIRLSKTLAEKLDFVAKMEGLSKTEIIRRSLEDYLPKHTPKQNKSAEDILRLIQKRSGIIPKIIKNPKDIFDEEELLG